MTFAVIESTPFEFMRAIEHQDYPESSRCLKWESTSREEIEEGFPPSKKVKDACRTVQADHNISDKYGFALVRTCGKHHMWCANPAHIKEKMLQFPDISMWLVNVYTGPVYLRQLKEELATMNKTLLYDDDFYITTDEHVHSNDEYFNYEVWQQLRRKATGVVTLDECQMEEVHVLGMQDEYQFHLKEEVGRKLYHKICYELLMNSSGLPATEWD
mmetsp:Transcript_60312/g.140479  ORF Transcript_60312/g.140479 Transcript_60312/m.140479 type:complete len:215 (-) Transcript_60312:88-732(-)